MGSFILIAVRSAGWFLAVVLTVLSVVPPHLRAETGAPHHLEHFAIFFATGITFGFGHSRRPVTVALALVTFAAAIEIAQKFVPGRHARWSDFLVDAAALCAGAMIGSFIGRRTLLRGA
jgi:VanZ family protein